jgi:hypothetical protein
MRSPGRSVERPMTGVEMEVWTPFFVLGLYLINP